MIRNAFLEQERKIEGFTTEPHKWYISSRKQCYIICKNFRHFTLDIKFSDTSYLTSDKFQTKILDTLPTLSHQQLDWNNIYESGSFIFYCINHQGFKIQRQESNKYSMKPLCISSCVSTRVHSIKKTNNFGAIQMFILYITVNILHA